MLLQELALLHHSRRTATVVSQDTVQLLTIGREAFFDIFMKVSEEDGIPEHIRVRALIPSTSHINVSLFFVDSWYYLVEYCVYR